MSTLMHIRDKLEEKTKALPPGGASAIVHRLVHKGPLPYSKVHYGCSRIGRLAIDWLLANNIISGTDKGYTLNDYALFL